MPCDRMCRLRLLLFWKTLLQRAQRYTLFCSRVLCLFRTALLSAGVLCRLLLSAAAASEAAGSELSTGGFTSAHISNVPFVNVKQKSTTYAAQRGDKGQTNQISEPNTDFQV